MHCWTDLSVFTILHFMRSTVHSPENCQKSESDRFPNPSDHSATSIRRRARFNSLQAPGIALFLCVDPSLTSSVSSAVWPIMLRRHLDAPAYDDSIISLLCSHCSRAMDKRGDHAANCKHRYGVVHRHNIVWITLARHAFRAAGPQCDREVPFLILGTAHCPADLLVQPPPPPLGALPDRPTAYDINPSVRFLIVQRPTI